MRAITLFRQGFKADHQPSGFLVRGSGRSGAVAGYSRAVGLDEGLDAAEDAGEAVIEVVVWTAFVVEDTGGDDVVYGRVVVGAGEAGEHLADVRPASPPPQPPNHLANGGLW